ncbi:hypothetical protein GF324_00500 [bacterium]|nr:hypothetical protein [bacterium]
MDVVTMEDLKSLIEERDELCTSLYMHTARGGDATQQNPVRFKNMLKQLESYLLEMGLDQDEADSYLETPREMIDDFEFWQHQSDGLAMFMTRDKYCYYRLPYRFDEFTMLSDRYHIKPMLPLISGDGVFYVLALSQNDVRLFRGSKFFVEQMNLEGVPTSLQEALRFDDPERSLQYHTAVRAPGGQASQFHGQGVTGKETHKTNILRFFQQIDKGLKEFLADRNAPLVLAGVDFLLPIYAEANSYPHLMEDGVPGNPEDVSTEDLHNRAWRIVAPNFEKERQDDLERFANHSNEDITSTDLREIVTASHQGRVDTLFVALGKQSWGFYYPDEQKIELHGEREAYDEDMLDYAAVQSFVNGAKVHAVPPEEVPGGGLAAAIYRF